MALVQICDRCSSGLDGGASKVRTTPSGQPPTEVDLCVSCTAEHATFLTTRPTWAIPAPVVVPLQAIPTKVG
jgi:hypothetical protein